jgi:hypothetical protein
MTRMMIKATIAGFAGCAMLAALGLAAGPGSGPGPVDAVARQSTSEVTRYTGADSSLTGRWDWAKSEAGAKGAPKGCWVGYSIERTMGERSLIGSFYSDELRNKPSLRALLTGVEADDLSGFGGGHDGKSEKMVKKEVGILLHIADGRSTKIDDMKVSNLSLRVDLDGDPLLWLGAAGYEESVTFLDARSREASTTDARKQFVMAIGLHDESKKAVDFLRRTLLGSGDADLREDAAFWLGQTGNDEARAVLSDVAWKDASEEVREKCVFSLSQMESEAALDDLIAIAKGHKDVGTRKHSAFWIGQMASEKAVGALKDLAYNDAVTEVQQNAIFALTQIGGNGGSVDELIKIARTHPNPKIRKDAIFWLGQSEDPKAVEALVEMVKGK